MTLPSTKDLVLSLHGIADIDVEKWVAETASNAASALTAAQARIAELEKDRCLLRDALLAQLADAERERDEARAALRRIHQEHRLDIIDAIVSQALSPSDPVGAKE